MINFIFDYPKLLNLDDSELEIRFCNENSEKNYLNTKFQFDR